MALIETFKQECGVEHTPEIENKLGGFDPKIVYGNYPGSLKLSKVQHKILVGKIRNLICDMYNEASEEELIRAIKYSMVAIDARKHRLDYKKAENDFGIPELYRKYHKRRLER